MMKFHNKPILILALLWVLTSCAPPPQPTPSPTPEPTLALSPAQEGPSLPTEPSALWIGWLYGPDSPNPFVAQWSEAYTIFDLVYSSLYRLTPDGEFVPDLVTDFTVSPDQRIWTFTIHSDVKFHDGTPLTARDVAFSFNLYGVFTEVQALNDTVFEIRLIEPIPNMIGHLVNLYVLPQHIWGRYENALETYDNQDMIGSGPFKMDIYSQDSFISLKAVSDHYAFPPKISALVFFIYPDEASLKDALVAGDIQMIFTLPYSELASIADAPNIEIVTGLPLLTEFEEVVFNQLNPEDCPETADNLPPLELPADLVAVRTCSGHPALRDPLVRIALSHAVDKTHLVNEVLSGYGNPGVSIIPIGLEHYFDPSLKDYTYDPAQANEILDQAGYLDNDGDHIREMPANGPEAGRSLTFRLYYLGPSLYYEQLVAQLALMWQKIGIDLEIKALDTELLTYICCPTYDYDIIIWSWDVEPEPGDIFDIFTTAEIPTSYNETGFSDPDYDILNAVQHTEIDETKHLQALWEMQRILQEQAAIIVLYYPQAIAAYRSDQFTGWSTDASHLELENFLSLTQVEPVK